MTTRPLPPRGQVAVLTALSTAMLRAILVVALPTALVAVVVAGLWVGATGAVSAAVGALLVSASSLITVFVMRLTRAGEPGAVMLAAFGSLMFKAIVLFAALVALGGQPWVHLMSLAVSMLAAMIVTTSAEGWAGYRFRSFTLDSPESPATSGSTSGRTHPATSAAHESGGRDAESTSAVDHPE